MFIDRLSLLEYKSHEASALNCFESQKPRTVLALGLRHSVSNGGEGATRGGSPLLVRAFCTRVSCASRAPLPPQVNSLCSTVSGWSQGTATESPVVILSHLLIPKRRAFFFRNQ